MRGEVPGNSLVQYLRNPAKEWLDDARPEVRSYARLPRYKGVGNCKVGHSLGSSTLVPRPYPS